MMPNVRGTKDAARLAGLHTAPAQRTDGSGAIAYGLTRKEGVIAVYDLGGGTFDISILRPEPRGV